MTNNREKLFEEFHSPTTQEWLDKIQVDLKGADFNKRLVWRTTEGFDVQPFYRREDLAGLKTPDALPGEFPYVRGTKRHDNTWYIRQDIACGADAKAANTKALDILNKGIDSLCFCFGGSLVSREYMEQLLDGIYCEYIEVNFNTCKRRSLDLARYLTEYYDRRGYDRDKIVGSFDWDPMEKIVIGGFDVLPILQIGPRLVRTLADWPGIRCVTVNAVSLSDNGAYIVQELGYALAWGHEYLCQLMNAGIDIDTAASKMKFNLGISGNYFMEIAKLRAARMLWAQIVKRYEPASDDSCKMCIHAVTSAYNMTVYDSYVNLLRTQTEAMSAALGGVHSIMVRPFDSAYEQPNDFAERIARNQQLLMKEESHFDKVVDPAGGSYYIETLTANIAREAWKVFLRVEDEGGFLASILKGTVQDDINKTNDRRHADAAKRKEFILGTNQFPNFNEKSDGKRGFVGSVHNCGHPVPFTPVNMSRVAADFEELRISVEQSQHIPVAFMLTIGNLAMRQARAQFSCNFLACAGYKVIDNLGFKAVEEGVDQALKAGADIIVLCSSDDEYAEYAIPAYRYLCSVGGKKYPHGRRPLFVVAGAPACMDDLKAAGIENFIHVRCNVLETLREYNKKLGI